MRIFDSFTTGIGQAIIASGFPYSSEDTSVYTNYSAIWTLPHTHEDPLELNHDNSHVKRAKRLGGCEIGTGHDSYLKLITVVATIEAPCYWWPQFQRYHFADIGSSQSKMHKLTELVVNKRFCEGVDRRIVDILEEYVVQYNRGDETLDTLLANVPQGLELSARIVTNYLQIKTMYAQRRYHRLKMWNTVFKEWVENELPHFMELTGGSYDRTS